MIPYKLTFRKPIFFLFLFLVFSWINSSAQDVNAGKTLFQQKCAACHNIFKDLTGPALMNLEERGQWSDHNVLLQWVHNPPGFMAKDAYTKGLQAKFGAIM